MAQKQNLANPSFGVDIENDALLNLLREIADNTAGGGGGGGGGAVTVADAADVTQGAKADARSAATDATAVTIMQVLKQISFMEQTPASRAVTNAGTFAVQASMAAGAATPAKAEDVASADADVGIPSMAVRKATPANTSGTDGDYEFLQMAAGRLWVSALIDTALPAGTNAIGKLAANDGVDIGDATINNAAGASAVNIQDGGNSITVDGTVAVTNTLLATGATGLGKAEDVASADADVGIGLLAVRKATPANTSGTDGDYEFIQMSAGRLWTSATIDTALPAGTNAIGKLAANTGVIIGDVNLIGGIVTTGATSIAKAEDAASANADTLIAIAGIRFDTPVANANVSADGDYMPILLDNMGKQWTADVHKEDEASADGDRGSAALAVRKATPANTSGTDGDYEFLQMSAGRLWVSATIDAALPAGTAVIGQTYGAQVECSTDVTRPADTTLYTANDCWSDSTSAPTAGGFTWTSAARLSGGAGIINDVLVMDSIALPGTPLQGELWVFNTAVTAVNDNAAFTVTDAEIKTCVAVIPFTIAKNGGANSLHHVQNLGIGFVCSGSANLRYLIKVINGYTPSSAEVLTTRAKILQTN